MAHPSHSPTLVLFDIDGTLVDSSGAGKRALIKTFNYMYGIPDAFVGYSFSGTTDAKIISHAFVTHLDRLPTTSEREAVATKYLELLAIEMREAVAGNRVRAFPGVHELIEKLVSLHQPIGLATGNLRDGARLKLEPHGLWDVFSFGGFGSDHEHRGELTALGIRRGLSAHELDPKTTAVWVVGDSPLDIEAARYSGARILSVATGVHSRDELQSHSPDVCVEDLSDTTSLTRLLTNP